MCQADAVIERILCLEEGGYVDVRRRLVVVLSRCRFSKRNTAELLRSDTIFVFNLRSQHPVLGALALVVSSSSNDWAGGNQLEAVATSGTRAAEGPRRCSLH